MATKNKQQYENREFTALQHAQEVILKFSDAIITETLDDTQVSSIVQKLNDPVRSLIKKVYLHMGRKFSNLNLSQNQSVQDNDLDSQIQSWADFVMMEMLRNKCECGKSYCSERHSLKSWVASKGRDLSGYLCYALWGYFKYLGKENSIVEGMLFPHFQRDLGIDFVLILFNRCGLCSEHYRGNRCEPCNLKFEETSMKKTVRKWFVLKSTISDLQVYHCKNRNCDNYYFPQPGERKSKCPLNNCQTEQPQRLTQVYQEHSEAEQLPDGFVDKSSSFSNSENAIMIAGACEMFFQETLADRPWMLALLECLSKRDFPSQQTIEQILQGTWQTDEKVEIICSVFEDTKQSSIPLEQIQEYLRENMLELKLKGKGIGKKTEDIYLSVNKLQSIIKCEFKEYVSSGVLEKEW